MHGTFFLICWFADNFAKNDLDENYFIIQRCCYKRLELASTLAADHTIDTIFTYPDMFTGLFGYPIAALTTQMYDVIPAIRS